MAAAEVRKKGQESVILTARYQDRAAALLSDALQRMPAAERTPFLREVVAADPELRTIRHRVLSPELAGPAASSDASVEKPEQ